jgi:hypothetical protein
MKDAAWMENVGCRDVEIRPIPASVILHPSSRVPFFSTLLDAEAVTG